VKTLALPTGSWKILLCSDGLSDFITDAQLLDGALAEPPGAMTLMNLALAAGGLDNISIILGSFKPSGDRVTLARV